MEEEIVDLLPGARNAVEVCMGVTGSDRVFVLTDENRLPIGKAIAKAAQEAGASSELCSMDEYQRPLFAMPTQMRESLTELRPTVTFFAAGGMPGELNFRMEFMDFVLRGLQARHAHMIGIDRRLMMEGMRADYREVSKVTMKVYGIVKDAATIEVTSEKGSHVIAQFNPRWRWIPMTGIYHRQGIWGNLPEGEVFTAPWHIEGIVVADTLGDYFSEKYGILSTPVTFRIQESMVVKVESEDKALVEEIEAYLDSDPNGRRVGEFAIGTNTAIHELVGNMLQDEKIPGLHVAFGDPYPKETGAPWHARTHIDVIPTNCTIKVDGAEIMKDGRFVGIDIE